MINCHKKTKHCRRDAILQVIYLAWPQRQRSMPFPINLIEPTKALNLALDQLCDEKVVEPLKALGISPAAWASRASHLFAISHATESIILCQQQMVDTQLTNQDAAQIKNLDEWLKKKGITWPKRAIIPFDLAAAICDGIFSMNSSKGKICNLLSPTSAKDDYGDPYDWSTFLDYILFLFEERHGTEISRNELNQRILCRKIMNNDGKYYNHTKIICIDNSVLYVGSDNIYPEYNEQHGAWIDRKENIQAWLDQYWSAAWGYGKDAINL